MNVIELASAEARKNDVSRIYSVDIEVGELSGVETEAFRFSLDLLAKESLLRDSSIHITTVSGRARCRKSREEFDMHELTAACPACGTCSPEILAGKEFRMKSMMAG